MYGPMNVKDQTQHLTVALTAVGNCSSWLFPRDKERMVLCILVQNYIRNTMHRTLHVALHSYC